jgi:hypothetical protein
MTPSNRGARVALLASLAFAAGSAANAADTAACDRNCLQDIADRYLSALVAHDPSKAPLASNVRITENGQSLGTEHGLWKTAAADSKFRLYFADPQRGAVGFIGLVMENDSPVPVSLRLKVVNGRVTEAETIVARNTSFAKPDGFAAPLPLLLAPVTAADRSTREAMVRIADSYFTGLDTDHSGTNVPFDPKCQRREDGNVTANSSDPKASPMQRLGCKAQFDTGFSVIVTKVRDRRYPIVDVEHGLVFAQVFFDHTGTVASFRMDGKDVEVPADFRRPKTLQIGELFKIEHGRIRQIEAVLVDVPYGMKSGWRSQPAAAPVAAAQPAAPAGCDHDCLAGFVDKYLAALLRHDPGTDLFASHAQFTENAQPLKLGDALWRTASAGPQGYKLVIADPDTGSVGFYILMQESGNPIWLSGRLKVRGQKITELETAIVRKGVSFGKFDRTAISPLWNEILKPDERRSREQLIAIANKYFDALDHHLSDSVPFDDACFRIENGVQTAAPAVLPAAELAMGGVTPPAPPAATSAPVARKLPDVGHIGCKGNINSNMWQYITQIQPRRCEVVDVERGTVQCIVLFHQDGEVPGTNVPGYGYLHYSGATRRPFDTLIPEVFKVRNGKIIEIEATMPSLPFGSRTGWE